MKALYPTNVGRAVRLHITALGYGARLFLRLLALGGVALRRFGLVRDQIHFLGNYSLAIIGVSGLFVGFVLGLQGYYTLQRYGATEALGLLVALSLVVSALAAYAIARMEFRGRDTLFALSTALMAAIVVPRRAICGMAWPSLTARPERTPL